VLHCDGNIYWWNNFLCCFYTTWIIWMCQWAYTYTYIWKATTFKKRQYKVKTNDNAANPIISAVLVDALTLQSVCSSELLIWTHSEKLRDSRHSSNVITVSTTATHTIGTEVLQKIIPISGSNHGGTLNCAYKGRRGALWREPHTDKFYI
jgi:hypothetical protein